MQVEEEEDDEKIVFENRHFSSFKLLNFQILIWRQLLWKWHTTAFTLSR